MFTPNGVFYFQISFSFQISLAFQIHSNLECVSRIYVRFPTRSFFKVVCLLNKLINRRLRCLDCCSLRPRVVSRCTYVLTAVHDAAET